MKKVIDTKAKSVKARPDKPNECTIIVAFPEADTSGMPDFSVCAIIFKPLGSLPFSEHSRLLLK